MKKLHFEDSNAFYMKLADALKGGEEVVLVTPFRSMREVPDRLKEAFKLEEFKRDSWVVAATGMFIAGTLPSAATAVGLNARPIVVLGSTVAGAAVGAGVGAMAGGVGAGPGAGAGALIGLAAGTIAASQMEGSHETCVEVDKNGKLKIHIKPTRA
jgi:hypothetical protein